MCPFDGSGNFSLSDTIAPATNADANELQAILTDIGTALDACFVADGQSTLTGAIKGADGSAALPAYAFSADLDSGWYRIGANNVGLSLGGTKRVDYATTGVSITGTLTISGTLTPSGQILSSDGTKTAPGYSFSGDVDTGVYRIGANNLGISCGDTKIFDISTTAVAITGTLAISGTSSHVGKASFTSTDSMALANGTTAQRNGSPTAGDVRYNSTLAAVEYWNGTVWIVLGKAPTTQGFASGSGTYTPPAGCVRIRVRMVGGGGGGGAQVLNAAAVAGGTTTFENWTAIGGGLGAAAGGVGGAGGSGGATGTGTLLLTFFGQAGGAGALTVTAGTNIQSGAGGSSAFGGGGGAGISAAGTGTAGSANSGGGGAGGTSGNSNTGAGGGGGQSVEFWMTAAQIGVGVSYAVGAGGAGGTAGTRAGGAGAAGVISVEEYYS